MPASKPRVGLVGLGYWGSNLLRNLVGSGKVDVIGGIDSSPEARAKTSRLYPQVSVFEDLGAFLASEKPDAMVIASPPALHRPMALQCLRAGAHVLIEKPMATTSKECEEILEAAAKAGRQVMVDHTFLYHPAVDCLIERASRGDFGKLLYYDSVRVNFGGYQATNVLWDLGPHDLSIIGALLSGRNPKRVSAIAAQHLGAGIEDLCYVTLQYEDGFVAHLHLNWMAPVKIRTIMLGGDRKMAVYDDNLPAEKVKIYDKAVSVDRSRPDFRVRYRVGDMLAPALPDTEALGRMIAHFIDCVQTGAKPRSDGQSGLDVVRILETASASARKAGELLAVDV